MAISMSDESSSNINFGTGASLTNLAQKTFLLWLNPANVDAEYNEICIRVNGSYLQGWNCFIETSAGVIQWDVSPASYSVIVTRSTNVFTSSVWQLLAVTVDHSTSGNNDIFRGTVGGDAVSVKDSGSSSFSSVSGYDDSANNVFLGAHSSGSNAFGGTYGRVAFYNVILTLQEIRDWQNFGQVIRSGLVLQPRLNAHLGIGATGLECPDWSGNGNNGQVVGGSNAAHPSHLLPLYPPAHSVRRRNMFAVAA